MFLLDDEIQYTLHHFVHVISVVARGQTMAFLPPLLPVLDWLSSN